MRLRCAVGLFLLSVSGCSDDERSPPPPGPLDCTPPQRIIGDRCLEPGVQDDGCPAGTRGIDDGSCQPAGIPAGSCGEGFAHDGNVGCEPILPESPCPPGLMAVPGDTQCREVMPCGADKWGDIQTEPDTEHVDASYTVGDSDGSASKPWPTIGDAVTAASPGAIVAIAEGSYLEDLVLVGKAVRLWGVCPSKVEVVGSGQPAFGCPAATLCIKDGASGAHVRGIALRGAAMGLTLSGAVDVTIEQIWVHDTAWRGVDLEDALGPTSASIVGSLIETASDAGMMIAGSEATVDQTVVRTTAPRVSDQGSGSGMQIQVPCQQGVCDASRPANVSVARSLIEQNRQFGIYVLASDASIESTVVRDTLPRAADQELGMGVAIRHCTPTLGCDPFARANATVARSVVQRNLHFGVYVEGSDATIDATVIADTMPRASDQSSGRGIGLQPGCSQTACDPTTRAHAEVLQSLVERNHNAGIFVTGSDAIVESTVVRDTLPRAYDQSLGFGISVQLTCTQNGCDPNMRGSAAVSWSSLERNQDTGLMIMGSDATVNATVVRDTLPRAANQFFGRGITVQLSCRENACDPNARGHATLATLLVEGNRDVGIFIAGSDASLDASLVRATSARADGLYGDGIGILHSIPGGASATLSRSRIEASARAGVANFGGLAALEQMAVACAAFALASEPANGTPAMFEDRGGNRCGCPTADTDCKATSAGLAPPEPPGDND